MKDNLSSSCQSQSTSSWRLTWYLTTNTSGREMLMRGDVMSGRLSVIISSPLSKWHQCCRVPPKSSDTAVARTFVHSLSSLWSDSRQSGNSSLRPIRDLRTELTWNLNDSSHSYFIALIANRLGKMGRIAEVYSCLFVMYETFPGSSHHTKLQPQCIELSQN